MREFVYFSKRAKTTGNFDDLMEAGRMDIAIHTVIHSFFVSNAERKNVKLHLFFYGPPEPPKHLEITSDEEGLGASVSKKDVSGLIKRMLYKTGENRNEIFPGCYGDKESLVKFVERMKEEGRDLYLLDEKGDNIREVEIGENPIFLMADHEGFPKKKLKRVKENCKVVSLGDITYFASQSLITVQHELDHRKIF